MMMMLLNFILVNAIFGKVYKIFFSSYFNVFFAYQTSCNNKVTGAEKM